MKLPIFRATIARDADVVQARQWSRAVASGLGFALQDQTRIATAVSEIARNAVAYARRARIEFGVTEANRRPGLIVRITDSGKGIADVDSVVAGRYRSTTGLGLGIAGAKRLMDSLDIETGATGTSVTMVKALPNGASLSEAELRDRIQNAAAQLERIRAPDPVAEVQQQNRELLTSLERLREREEELTEANSELRLTADALSESLQEKDVLIREVHHRVKNNLQIITSLIGLQAARSATPEVREELNNLSGRIRSLSLIHDRLYQGDNLARIDLRDYAVELCTHLKAFFDAPARQVSLACELCALQLPLDAAINLGLIVNELVTNAYKHAFTDGQPGVVEVSAAVSGDELILTVADNGRGLPDAAKPARREQSLGMTLVRTMTARLGGRLDTDGTNGTRVTLTIPLSELGAGDARSAAAQ